MTPTQTLNEIMKGCWKNKVYLKFHYTQKGIKDEKLKAICGDTVNDKIVLCPSCQSRLTQFKNDLKNEKERIENKMKVLKERYKELNEPIFKSQVNYSYGILQELLAPLDEAIKQMEKE